VSITDSGSRCLTFAYQISSPRIELAVYKFQTGKTESSLMDSLKYTDQENIARWNWKELDVNSKVEAIQLVAKKTGVTMNVEYVLVDVIGIDICLKIGNAPFNVFLSRHVTTGRGLGAAAPTPKNVLRPFQKYLTSTSFNSLHYMMYTITYTNIFPKIFCSPPKNSLAPPKKLCSVPKCVLLQIKSSKPHF